VVNTEHISTKKLIGKFAPRFKGTIRHAMQEILKLHNFLLKCRLPLRAGLPPASISHFFQLD
jgi:hypothetical protein